MLIRPKIKLAALFGFVLSAASLLVHFLLAKHTSEDLVTFHGTAELGGDILPILGKQSIRYRKLWGPVKSLETIQPYPNPRSGYPAPSKQSNGFIYAKIFGGFEKIRSSICDLVTISRLLNATLVIPEIQESTRLKGISSKFKSFSYLYNEDQFIAALTNDVVVVKSLPKSLKEARKRKKFPTFTPKKSASPDFYIREVLPSLKKAKVVGLVITNGGCLQTILPPSMVEYQRLRCRVAFHALQFRTEIQELGHKMVQRMRGLGQPYLAFHPGLLRDKLAYHGCAELFQDVHTELIQYRRAEMIKQEIIQEELTIDSRVQKRNGSCPLMPEEVGLLLKAIGYLPETKVYVAGSEIFGGQRVLIPLRAMYLNLMDYTSLCTKKELSDLIGPETPLPLEMPWFPPPKSEKQLIEEWNKAGPRPRPLPPPPARPIYQHEKEGWYGWITETDTEPDPSPMDLRMKAHQLLWDALDYIVSVKADAFFPGFHSDGSGWPDFSSLVMGHRLYERPSARTYRPDRKFLTQMFDDIHDNLYHPKRNWTVAVREHLNRSLNMEGLTVESVASKPTSFLSHPLPECSCRTTPISPGTPEQVKGRDGKLLYGGEDECPEWMKRSLESISLKLKLAEDEGVDESDSQEDNVDVDEQESDDGGRENRPLEQDEEMDPDD
ncbi:protein EMBRYO SAC DEVELOPMENT ARREST 30 [Magnolia sinica]|uniref:protein EMBRYO SAC DEVELOPMENT ARREST 30 n=1 Tax=Magnolia sinica TaxID=86752 RepID=UPI00265AD70A|nr:protein EMBRYO SAC DEVELOPMENT ARREST 30 [Magnolia sinica]XP_058113077.1 protein EMBRYO SAC DEVELOPMENT ARREST 30 [Magnolia sinica]XP_058113078.1 protein EMBRYO SAC DEVELOPMENT ARREST 30 [Magnolia sinica]